MILGAVILALALACLAAGGMLLAMLGVGALVIGLAIAAWKLTA